MNAKVRHCAIVTTDINILKNFYQKTFGFNIASHELEQGHFLETVVGIKDAKIDVCKLRDPNGIIIELLEYINPKNNGKESLQDSNKLGHSHIALTVNNINEFYEDALKNGASRVNPPLTNQNKTAIVCYLRDPQGNILELVEEI